MTAIGGAGLDLPPEDEATICEVDGCGREFPDLLAWQEHYEDTHEEDDDI